MGVGFNLVGSLSIPVSFSFFLSRLMEAGVWTMPYDFPARNVYGPRETTSRTEKERETERKKE